MKLSDYHEIIGLSDLFGTLGTLFRGLISLLSLFTTLINYDINLSMCDTFLTNLLPLTDNRGLLSTPKETCDSNLFPNILSIQSFRTPTSIFGTKQLYNPGLLPYGKVERP